MAWFARARTGKRAKASQGVSQPSQQRFVTYVERLLEDHGFYTPCHVLHRIVMRTCPQVEGGCRLWYTVEINGKLAFDSRESDDGVVEINAAQVETVLEVEKMRLEGDVRFVFYSHSDEYDAAEICGVGTRHYVAADELLCFLWFHTGFAGPGVVHFDKVDIDVACHDHKCKVFKEGFALDFYLESAAATARAGSGGALERGHFRKLAPPSRMLMERWAAMNPAARLEGNAGSFPTTAPTEVGSLSRASLNVSKQ